MDIERAIELLVTHRTFAGLDAEDFQPLCEVAHIEQISVDTKLFSRGDELRRGFILLQGRLEESGEVLPRRRTARQHYSPGSLVAPSGFIKAWPSWMGCTALEDSEVLAVERSDFLDLLEAGDVVVLRILDDMLDVFVGEIRDSNRLLDEIHSRPHETLELLRELAEEE